jgi:hypothetical protein
MFDPFGIPKSQVIETLNSCKDSSEARRAFLGLKVMAYGNFMKMDAKGLSDLRRIELMAITERLKNIDLKNYNPPNSKGPNLDSKVRTTANIYDMLKNKDIDGLMGMLDPDSSADKKRTQSFVDSLINEVNKRKGKGK